MPTVSMVRPQRILVLAVAWIAIAFHGDQVQAQVPKMPVPPEQARTRTLALLQEIYRPQYEKAKSQEDRSDLAREIVATAYETNDDPVAKYVMLRVATDIAVQAGDAETVVECIRQMALFYEIDEFEMRTSALTSTANRVTANTEEAMLPIVIDLCRDSIERREFDGAKELLRVMATRASGDETRRTISALSKRIDQVSDGFAIIADHLKTLEENPDDPTANLEVGSFWCFTERNWQTGLPHLAKSDDEGLRKAAELELAKAKDFQAQNRIADQWWSYAQSTDDPSRKAEVQIHAATYYQQALASLTGLQKVKASSRLKEAQLLGPIPPLGQAAKPNPAVRADVGGVGNEIVPLKQRVVTFDLPSGFTDMTIGGSGRYLIFLLNSLKKLAFFDVSKREVTRYITLESSDIRFAANAQSLFIAKRPANIIERWSLETFDREATVKLPFEHPIEVIATGYASSGPVYAGTEKGPGVFLNARSLRPLPYQIVDHQYQRPADVPGAGSTSRVRASANGRAYSFWRTQVSPGGFRVVVLDDRLGHMFYDHDTMGYIAPSPDGELMFTSKGIFTNQTKEFASNNELHSQSFHVPGIGGDYSISVPRNDNRGRNAKTTTSINVHVNGHTSPILTLPDITMRPGEYGDFHGREIMTLDRRIYFMPQYDVLITLPASNKSIVQHRVDLQKELEDSGVDYLYVVSRAPTTVKAGGTYKYQIETKSRLGDVKYEVVSGPPSMRVSKDGLITWRTSRRGTNNPQDVIVSITDASGQTITHTFKVTLY
ncbi:MAG: hypothetical protein ACR2NZ_20320 [Rubripirellula sp.]